MKKHILFIVENNSFPKDVRVRNEAIAAFEYGYDVSVICPVNKKTDKKFEQINGIDVYRHPMPIEAYNKWGFIVEYANALFWETLLSIRVYIKKRFHAIHAANPPDHVFLIALPYKLFGVKYIFDHHDICPENYFAKFNRKDFLYRVMFAMEKLTFITADLVISTNESYKKIAISRGNKKDGDVFVVRNGPDMNKIRKMCPNEMLRDGFKYLVGYVGIIAQQEGIDNLLEIVDYLVNKRNITYIKFIIIGTGPYWKHLVQLSKSKGVDRYVVFTGYIPDEELHQILSTVDLCVNPEFGNEFTDKSTMIKIMEYMTFGKPIIQFYTTEGEVTAQNAAYYIRENSKELFAQAIIELLDNPQKRNEMGQFGLKRIEEVLSWQIQKQNLMKAYRSVIH